MKSSSKKEEADPKKKYVFFSDPDTIVRRAETSAAAAQARQFFKIRQQQEPSLIGAGEPAEPVSKPDLKGLETLLTYHPVQPYPFTFITAVKRKLALSVHTEACKKAYEPKKLENVETCMETTKINTEYKPSISQGAQKMEFIKPLKVPDLKIAQKSLDYSPRENASPKEIVQQKSYLAPNKFETPSREGTPQKERAQKSSERVQRKLDFSVSDGSPIKSCENIEPLKAPDVSISSGLTKKKEHARDSSREKENRSKRIKKDDVSFPRTDDVLQDTPKRSKSSKHVSRKDDMVEYPIFKMFKTENFLTSASRDSDFAFKKPKSKNFVTSTAKKDDDRRHRSASMQMARSTRERSLESRNRTCSNDSISERSARMQERITVRDGFRGMGTENIGDMFETDNRFLNILRQTEDSKLKNVESSTSKLSKQSRSTSQSQTKQIDTSSKEQVKRIYDKPKPSTSKVEMKNYNSASEISEDVKTASDSNTSLRNRIISTKIDTSTKTESPIHTDVSTQKSKSKVSSEQIGKSVENSEDSSHLGHFSNPNVNLNTRQSEESMSQTDTAMSSAQSNPNSDFKNSNSESLPESLLDPRRISFRDENYTQQDEFCDLITPDIILMPRSKRKKQPAREVDSEANVRSPKHKPTGNVQTEDGGIQLLHPTALHMQFQAELHLLDSFNESLRQVMDVEKCLYGVNHEQEQVLLQKQMQENEEMRKRLISLQAGRDTIDTERPSAQQSSKATDIGNKSTVNLSDSIMEETDGVKMKITKRGRENQILESHAALDNGKQGPNITQESDNISRKHVKPAVKMTEVQTQTVNDIATQTDIPRIRRRDHSPGRQLSGITYERGSLAACDILELSLPDQLEDLDQIEDVSLPSRMRTMSEISLHETTSSIKTETGTEISISTRDVTCSFNKYLDLELAQLIKDEKQRYDEIEMLFKSREKTLNDRTKKLVKLEEQKRVLRDTGQDSRISSVKKKQRALLLKLQQEKDEMNRLKELHKMASQERKLMLQKQRNMFNPQMSTKNILTKLKRSADSQSPRRLSGPMKGYDIRSPSSMSSLVDSDKSQVDRTQVDTKSQISDRYHKSEGKSPRSDLNAAIHERHEPQKMDIYVNAMEQSDALSVKSDVSNDSAQNDAKPQKAHSRYLKNETRSKYEVKSRKYEEKMPRADVIRYKSHDVYGEPKALHGKTVHAEHIVQKSKTKEVSKLLLGESDKSISENIKSESDTLVEELSKRSKSSQATEIHLLNLKSPRERERSVAIAVMTDSENIQSESDSIPEEFSSKRSKLSQVAEDISQANSKIYKRSDKSLGVVKELAKKVQVSPDSKTSSKRKGSRSQKSKSSSDILTENILRSKSGSQISEEIIKHHGKRSKIEKDETQSEDDHRDSIMEEIELNDSQSSLQALVKHSKAVKEKNYELLKDIASEHEAKENASARNFSNKNMENFGNATCREEGDLPNLGNISTRSQVSTLTISRHSSGDSEKSFSRSVVIRAQDHHFRTSKKLEQILSAREAALASRRNCVEEWIAWHARLRAEESRIARMEQAAFKLVSAASNALSYHDTTASSDTSDVEGRIEVLTEKLAERRIEMARLKKEARRQAKQRLKALEANLLNQIKKYDTTIQEMRDKLESKKGTMLKDGLLDKLAIESKVLADFKVPVIPIRRLQELYKISNLLQSRSESDLRTHVDDKNDQEPFVNTRENERTEKIVEDSSARKFVRSVEVDGTEISEPSNAVLKTTTPSIQSMFEDSRSTASGLPDCVSENIENKTITEEIESDKYLSTHKSHTEIKSDDSISTEILSEQYISERIPTTFDRKDSPASNIRLSHDCSTSVKTQSAIPESIQSGSSTRSFQSELPLTISEEHVPKSVGKSISMSASSQSASKLEYHAHRDYRTDIDLQSPLGRYSVSEAPPKSSTSLSSRQSSKGTMKNNESKNVSQSELSQTIPQKVMPWEIGDSQASHVPDKISSESEHIERFTDSVASDFVRVSPLTNNKQERISTPVSTALSHSSIKEEIKSEDSPTLSKKINSLELGNKNLNEDISTLENDLKALSTLMSQFGKRSGDNLKSDIFSKHVTASEKSTSKDVSEELPKSELYCSDDKTESIMEDAEQKILSKSEFVIESNKPIREDSSKTNDNVNNVIEQIHESSAIHDRDLAMQVTEIMAKIMPDKDNYPTTMPQEIDFEARSKEILNEIGKSITFEHVKSTDAETTSLNVDTDENVHNLHKENVAISHDLNSLESEIKSIAEIISKMADAKRGLSSAAEIASRSPQIEDKRVQERTADSLGEISDIPESVSKITEDANLKITAKDLINKASSNEKIQGPTTDEHHEPTENYATSEDKSIEQIPRDQSKKSTSDNSSIKNELIEESETSGKLVITIVDSDTNSNSVKSYIIQDTEDQFSPDYVETLNNVAETLGAIELQHSSPSIDIALSGTQKNEIIEHLKDVNEYKEDVNKDAEVQDVFALQKSSLSRVQSLETSDEDNNKLCTSRTKPEHVLETVEGEKYNRESMQDETVHFESNNSQLLPSPEFKVTKMREDDSLNAPQSDNEFEYDDDNVHAANSIDIEESKKIVQSFEGGWTTSDSFEIQQNITETSASQHDHAQTQVVTLESVASEGENDFSIVEDELENNSEMHDKQNFGHDQTLISEMSVFFPNYESTKIEAHGVKFDDSVFDSNLTTKPDGAVDKMEDTLDIVVEDTEEAGELKHVVIEDALEYLPRSVTRILDKAESAVGRRFGQEQIDIVPEVDSVAEQVESPTQHTKSERHIIDFENAMGSPQTKADLIDMSIESVQKTTESDENGEKSQHDAVESISITSIEDTDDLPVVHISLSVKIEEELKDERADHVRETDSLVITELVSESLGSGASHELESVAKIELADDSFGGEDIVNEKVIEEIVEDLKIIEESEIDTSLKKGEFIETERVVDSVIHDDTQDSSDGDQLDNLVEVAESELETVEKIVDLEKTNLNRSTDEQSDIDNAEAFVTEPDIDVLNKEAQLETKKEVDFHEYGIDLKEVDDNKALQSELQEQVISAAAGKGYEIIRDPEYEDISEESLEVSEIFDKSEPQRSLTKKSHKIPEKYEVTQKSEDVLRILEEISQKSSSMPQTPKEFLDRQSDFVQHRVDVLVHHNENLSHYHREDLRNFDQILQKSDAQSHNHENNSQESSKICQRSDEVFSTFDIVSEEQNQDLKDLVQSEQLLPRTRIVEKLDHLYKNEDVSEISEAVQESANVSQELEALSQKSSKTDDEDKSEDPSQKSDELSCKSESSEGVDTPRGVPDIEMDSPRDPNDSRLDVDALDDDLLACSQTNQSVHTKPEFHVAPIVTTSEKDIEAMIEKLKASLEQPGLDVAELEAKLLRIQQLQIELEIKKLEAEEVSYYVREIPNKPPPPYTPPGGGRLSISHASPSPPPAVVPSNVEDLTTFTEKATNLIFAAKQAGEDIVNLEAPIEICELNKDSEAAKKDRKIYNTFLFDLCKETIAEVYHSEYEKPGPSWLKPNVKTKPTVKIPKTVEDLNEYVGKEVATLFGFKTKLQRENLVMRWSRKRRDRVDELLAREAQAEEDEWTKFHHDELAVKNELTTAILDSLILETANVVKAACAKKRKVAV